MKAIPAPSPNGTNFEKLFLVRARSGGALDAALRHGRDGHEQDLSELHRKLEHLITTCVPEDHLHTALEMLNEVLGGRRYGEHEAEDEEGEEEHREKLRAFAEHHGLSDDAAEELHEMLGSMPRNGREGGQGGRLAAQLEGRDRRHGARDRRRHAMDSTSASSSFAKMFPGAARIRGPV